MKEESSYKPAWQDITPTHPYIGPPDYTRKEVVGIHLIIENGYATKLVQSDRKAYDFRCPEDVIRWMAIEDRDRMYFVRGRQGEWDSLMKWFGREVLIGTDQEVSYYLPDEGYRVRLGEVSVSFKRDMMVIYKGARRMKRINDLYVLYQMSNLLPDEVDCDTAKALADVLLDGLHKHLLPYTTLSSAGDIFQCLMSLYGIEPVKSTTAMSDEAIQMALNCYHTNWSVAFALGHFPEVYDYDITSAYPSQVRDLISCHSRYGDWVPSSQYVAGAEYGMTRSIVEIPPDLKVSPLLFRMGRGRNGDFRTESQANPGGTWVGYVMKDEIDFLYYVGGKVTILDGWWFVPKERVHPFREPIDYLLAKREKTREESFVVSNVCKLTGAASQGKFLSVAGRFGVLRHGPLFQPVYAATIVSRTRVKVAMFCLEHQDSVLNVAVDGVLMDKEVPAVGGTGEMRLHHKGEGIILGDGEYYVPGRSAGSHVPDVLEEYFGKSYYVRPKRGRFTLWEGAMGRVPWEKVGQPCPYPTIRLSRLLTRPQRLFPNTPKYCGDYFANTYPSFMRDATHLEAREAQEV